MLAQAQNAIVRPKNLWPPADLPMPYYCDDAVVLYHADCRDILPLLAPQCIDLVLTDPQWGSNTCVDNRQFKRFRPTGSGARIGRKCRQGLQPRRAVYGDTEPFDPTHLLRFSRSILWGANWYASRLPDSGGWIVWDKRQGIEDSTWSTSEAELAWTNLAHGIRIFRHRWFGLIRASDQGEHYHPTQKPVALMQWCLERWSKPGNVVLDPYAGSGPVGVAAKNLQRRAILCEIEEDYCEVIVKRLRQEVLL